MRISNYAAIAAGLLFASGASAAEIAGGSLKLSYSAFADDTSVSRLGVEGSIEVAFNQQFSTQLDLGYQSFGETDIDEFSYGLHAIYHLDSATSIGAFYAREELEGADLDLYGIEAGYETGQWEFEGNLGRTSTNGDDATVFGGFARYEFANQLGLTGSYDQIEIGDLDVSRIALKLDRDVSPSVNLFLEVGSADVDVGSASTSEVFVGLGGKIAFGAERGVTFEQRGLLRLIPGL